MKSLLLIIALTLSLHAGAQLRLPQQVISPVDAVSRSIPDIAERRLPKPDDVTDTLREIPEKIINVPELVQITDLAGDVIINEARDTNGELVVAREWLLYAPGEQHPRLQHPDIHTLSSRYLPALSLTVLRIRVSASLTSLKALQNVLPDSVEVTPVKHHIYLTQAGEETSAAAKPAERARCARPVRLGLVDTALAENHPQLSHLAVTQRSFLPDEVPHSVAHGTAVAGLAAAAMPAESQLIAANVFYSRSSVSQGATLMALLEGLNYLAESGVEVINMSLTGPANALLAQAVGQLSQNGIQIAAAAGNEGPAALPRYPAAYDETIAVTAVDSNDTIYRWANQGEYVELAAPGVSVKTARADGQLGSETGTSMAAPVVAARLACLRTEGLSPAQARSQLQQRARDLGEPGRDPVFGFGVIDAGVH
ncbi:S8 family serine peptidase [Alteromonas sp. ASW11-19]|uniref:S8 family serine peptidase n=1 Tax=Alteromonas salexigens TaxID=2982530 RepID=A0ABT2VJK4_9ALTE|nr:S8 family serine peptidase [Alteromonas salexigens]MCU7553417.1 S8 family serine peptidase [Alteromonas salexigens]